MWIYEQRTKATREGAFGGRLLVVGQKLMAVHPVGRQWEKAAMAGSGWWWEAASTIKVQKQRGDKPQ